MFLEELALGPLASLHLVERVRNLGLRRTRVLVGDVLRCAERVIARRACRDTDERTDRRYGNCERTNTLLTGGFLHYHSFFRRAMIARVPMRVRHYHALEYNRRPVYGCGNMH